MPYIELVPIDDADGKVGDIYAAAHKRAGYVAQIIQVMSQDAATLDGMMQLYIALMKRPNALSAARREMIAAVVSGANDCYY